MEEIILKIKKIGIKEIEKILVELDKHKLQEIQKMVILKKAFDIDSSKAQDIILSRYRSKATDSLLGVFLGLDEDE